MFSDTHLVEIPHPEGIGTGRMSGPTYLGWKVPVDGGLFNIYAIGWKGEDIVPNALCVYFHPEGAYGYERIIISFDEKFKESERAFKGNELSKMRYSTRAEELRNHLPQLEDADLPGMIHVLLDDIE